MSLELYAMKAQECEERAGRAKDARERAEWLSMAAKWRRLAVEVKQRHRQLWGAASCDESELGAGAVLRRATRAQDCR